eukprot:1039661-Ditylum_brightwellii.AAC.1
MAKFTSAQCFESLLVCRAQINNIQSQVQAQSDNASTSISNFQSFIAQQPEHVQHLLDTLKAEEVNPDYWINAITEGQVTIAMYGSVAHKKGYFAVIFHSADKSIHFQGPCDGNSSLMTSYRMELTGIFSTLYLLHTLIRYKNAALHKSPLLYCANISAVKATNTAILPGIKHHVSSDFDIIKEIHDTKQGLASFLAHWVKMHQDNRKT